MESRTALRAAGLTKSYGPTRALRGVDLVLARGEIHAVLGHNGSGKSTLIRILAGVDAADSGRVWLADEEFSAARLAPAEAHRAGLRFVHQNPGLFRDFSIAENLALGALGYPIRRPGGAIAWGSLQRTAAELLERFHIDADPRATLNTLSPAAQHMVAIARALADSNSSADRVLVLDEPTATLPESEVRVLLEALRRYADAGQAILYVTQRLHEIDERVDRVTVLRNGAVEATGTGAELMGQPLARLVSGVPLEDRRHSTRAAGRPPGPPILEVDGLRSGPLSNVTFELAPGEVVGLAGLMGSGRTTLLKTIFGAAPFESGQIRLAGSAHDPKSPRGSIRVGVGLVPEDRAGEAVFPDLRVADNATAGAERSYWKRGRLQHRRERSATAKMLVALAVHPPEGDRTLATLSGGNQQKVVFGRWLLRRAQILLLDEPTQGVDVGVRQQIHELVADQAATGTAVMYVSSDFHELAEVCHRVLILRDGVIAQELPGTNLDPHVLSDLASSRPAGAVAA